ncbi:hypothetical protein EVAR_83333_1 [Eumeta japonica]|uniref:Uncharacterized protein n=1 Tax=Eumeta variegata TaxID=151549 RepID=A0A4C1VY12_EUMVA|nr:hypothetical protein EVAR_83333_1 [Eumeta japonica]
MTISVRHKPTRARSGTGAPRLNSRRRGLSERRPPAISSGGRARIDRILLHLNAERFQFMRTSANGYQEKAFFYMPVKQYFQYKRKLFFIYPRYETASTPKRTRALAPLARTLFGCTERLANARCAFFALLFASQILKNLSCSDAIVSKRALCGVTFVGSR